MRTVRHLVELKLEPAVVANNHKKLRRARPPAQGPKPDTTRLLSGHPAGEPVPPLPADLMSAGKWGAMTTPGMTAWIGPWGTSFAPNLTPDPTGIDGWEPATFISAMRTGKHLGTGRPILPPMPWASVGKMADQDLRALFAYLRSLKPISNAVSAPLPPTAATR
jgi:hypothetical protein